MMRATWLFNRLRCMSGAEIAHRIGRMAQMQAERATQWWPRPVPKPDLAQSAVPWITVPDGLRHGAYVDAAERICAGRFDVFALHDADLGEPPRWNRDPRTGVDAPLQFGKLLDYRNERLVGDIKYLWEPNRHLHLVTLAQAHALTGERRYYDRLQAHLDSWFNACPYGRGPSWASALESGLRLINWSIAWQLLGGAASPLFADAAGARLRTRWLDSVYRHAEFVRGHFSLHSSANNHLIGEAAGLFIAAVTWPHWPRARRWRDSALAILEREALLQNAPDGVNREQAMSYQQFVLDLLLLPLLAGRANGVGFSLAYQARLEAMVEYIQSVMDMAGNLPMIGDADDAYVARLAPQGGFCRYRSLCATGAVLFRRAEFKAQAGELDDKTLWLLGDQARNVFAALPAAPPGPVRRSFPHGGYYLLGCDFGTPAEIRLLVDAGALGYGRIAAHGHADALAFTLSLGGREFLIDPGTYAYHTESRWRSYFRGTRAHNTLCVDGLDQSVSGGNFMWLAKALTQCTAWHSDAAQDRFEGWHDGYLRLADPVLHRRCISLDKRARHIVVEDILDMDGPHEIALHFHCSEHCTVRRMEDTIALQRDGIQVTLRLPQIAGAHIEILHGSEDPIGGWVSRRYDHKQPSPTLVWRAKMSGPVRLRSEIRCPVQGQAAPGAEKRGVMHST